MNGEELPNVVEIWIEDFCYVLTLWWEVRLVLRAVPARKRGMKAVTAGEVGGEDYACTGKRVLEEVVVTRLEALPLSADGTRRQTCGSGQPVEQLLGGPLVTGLAEPPWSSDMASGPTGLVPVCHETGPSLFGTLPRKVTGWAKAKEPLVVHGQDCQGLFMPCAKGKALSSEAHPPVLTGPSLLGGLDSDISSFWMKNGLKKQFEEESRSEESSNTDDALLEEALRYETASTPIGLLVLGSPASPSSFSGQTPLGEYYDFSGAGWEIV